MRIKSLMKNKKAFSAIIAALILMLIAVAAGVVVYAYVMGWIGGVQTNPPGTGIITIESYTIDETEDVYTLYIRNHGTSNLEIDTIYINGELIPIDPSEKPITLAEGLNTIVNEGEEPDLIIADLEFEAGDLVKVVCTDGTTVSQTLV